MPANFLPAICADVLTDGDRGVKIGQNVIKKDICPCYACQRPHIAFRYPSSSVAVRAAPFRLLIRHPPWFLRGALQYVPMRLRTKDLCREAVSKNPLSIQDVPEK